MKRIFLIPLATLCLVNSAHALGGSQVGSASTQTIKFKVVGELSIGFQTDMFSPAFLTLQKTQSGAAMSLVSKSPNEVKMAKEIYDYLAANLSSAQARIFRGPSEDVVLISTGQRHRPSDAELNDLLMSLMKLLEPKANQLGLLVSQSVMMK